MKRKPPPKGRKSFPKSFLVVPKPLETRSRSRRERGSGNNFHGNNLDVSGTTSEERPLITTPVVFACDDTVVVPEPRRARRCWKCQTLLPGNRVHFATTADTRPCEGSWGRA